MWENSTYQKGLLYLLHSVALADGVAHEYEKKAIAYIKDHENIPEKLYSEFIRDLDRNSDREIYQIGLSLILQCTPQERRRAMAWVYRVIEADNHVDIKEAVWLLKTITRAATDWSEVNDLSKKLPSFFGSQSQSA